MIKRNRHKISYRTSKKGSPKRRSLKGGHKGRFSTKAKRTFGRQGFVPSHRWEKWNGINNTVINTEIVK